MIAQRHDIDITDRSQTVSGHEFLERLGYLGRTAVESAGKAQGQIGASGAGEDMCIAGRMVLIDRGKECCGAASSLREKILFGDDPADGSFLKMPLGKDL